jgi:hypothetical protein
MKALFLDVDGVLNSLVWTQSAPADLFGVDQAAVDLVRRLMRGTGAQLVLSSTWRLMPDMIFTLHAAGVPDFYGVTPRGDAFGTRSTEIEAYLAAHPEVDTFAIVDDDADAGLGRLAPHFVQTDDRFGLTLSDFNRLADILGRLHVTTCLCASCLKNFPDRTRVTPTPVATPGYQRRARVA